MIAALRNRDLWKETHQPERVITATYDYTDEDGRLLYQVVLGPTPKDFKQRRPDGAGGWGFRRKGDRQVLYHLPGVWNSDRLYHRGRTRCRVRRVGFRGDDKRRRR